jgi:hypothetical protein
MKTTIRTHVAALALLLPAAVSLAPATAAAQSRWNQPQLSALAVDSDGGLAPGATLRLRLNATPGARWSDVTLGDSGIVVALREERPGTYVGSYTIRRHDRLEPRDMLQARAAYGDRTYTASFGLPPSLHARGPGWRGDERRDDRRDDRREERREERRDARGPVVPEVWPVDGSRTQESPTRVAAKFADEGTGVDAGSVRLRVDGRDVTARTRVTPGEVYYTADMERGRHTAELTVRDKAGNSTTRAWSFEVAATARNERAAAPAAPVPVLPPITLQLTSPTENAVVDGRNGNIVVTGRTAPMATVQVEATAHGVLGGGYQVHQPIGSNTVRADAQGNFTLTIVPQAKPDARELRYEVRVKANNGQQTTEQRVTLRQREG